MYTKINKSIPHRIGVQKLDQNYNIWYIRHCNEDDLSHMYMFDYDKDDLSNMSICLMNRISFYSLQFH